MGTKRRPRGVVDTSVLAAGVAGFRERKNPAVPAAQFLRTWIERDSFVWLVTEDILDEYKRVLRRLGVQRRLIGTIINLLREEAEFVPVSGRTGFSPDVGDDPFCDCAESGNADFIVTLNPRDFPQERLRARVFVPGISPKATRR